MLNDGEIMVAAGRSGRTPSVLATLRSRAERIALEVGDRPTPRPAAIAVVKGVQDGFLPAAALL
jgi:hypothetical protein